MLYRLIGKPAHMLVILALVCLACGTQVGAAPAPSAFQVLPTVGVTDSPTMFASGQLSYTLTLSSGAYLIYEETLYPITQVWGVYAVNNTGSSANNFSASGSDIGEWDWDQNPQHKTEQSVAGWLDAPKKEALVTPESGDVSKTFAYSGLTFTGSAPLLGLHVTVSVPDGKCSPFGCGNTGDIIPTRVPSLVPEPSAVLAILTGVAGLVGLARRRRN